MDQKILAQYQDKILIGLADFFFESGYKSNVYNDPNIGGIYENKLEERLGLQSGNESPSAEFNIAAQMLEAKGYVRRMKRMPDSPLMGIWPTALGLERATYLKASVMKKISLVLKKNSQSIFVSALTTIITLLIAWLFKLFGLGS